VDDVSHMVKVAKAVKKALDSEDEPWKAPDA